MPVPIREKIFNAADEIYADTGKTPSIRQVLDVTGGSSSTVQKYLREWQSAQAQRVQQLGFPLQVQRALSEAWTELLAASRAAFDEERQTLEVRIQSLEAQLSEAANERQGLEARLAASEELARGLSEQLAAERQRLEQAAIQSETLKQQLTAAAAQVEQAQQRVEDAAEAHAKNVESLKMAHERELARLTEMATRAEDRLLREIDALREQLRGAEREHRQAVASLSSAAETKQQELRHRLEEQSARLQDLHTAFGRCDATRDHLDQRCNALELRLTESEAALSAARQEQSALQERLRAAEEKRAQQVDGGAAGEREDQIQT